MSPVSSGSVWLRPAVLPRRSFCRIRRTPVGGELPDDLVGAVVRAVRDDDDFAPVRRVVERQRVLELGADDVGLVVGRDHEAHRRRDVGLAHRPWPAHRDEQPQQQRIAHDDVGEHQHRHEKDASAWLYGMFLIDVRADARWPPAPAAAARPGSRGRTSGSSGSGLGGGAPLAFQYSQTSAQRLGAPLLLEVKRALVGRRAAEVEHARSRARWRTSACASRAARWRRAGWTRAAPMPTAPRSSSRASSTSDAATGRPS